MIAFVYSLSSMILSVVKQNQSNWLSVIFAHSCLSGCHLDFSNGGEEFHRVGQSLTMQFRIFPYSWWLSRVRDLYVQLSLQCCLFTVSISTLQRWYEDNSTDYEHSCTSSELLHMHPHLYLNQQRTLLLIIPLWRSLKL